MAASGLRLPASGSFAASRQARLAPVSRHLTIARADGPRVSSGRVFREKEDGSVEEVSPASGSAQPTPQSGQQSIYVDANAPQMRPKPKDNLSKEMKQRLREEYYGIGGAENKAMSNNYFLWIVVVISALAVASKLSGALD